MSDKTEEPTDKKLEDARKKGQSPKSTDINAAVGLVGVLLMLMGSADAVWTRLANIVTRSMKQGLAMPDNDALYALIAEQVKDGMLAALPIVMVAVVLAVVALFAQIGFNLSFEAIAPKFEKLNPAEGLKKIVSVRSLIELAKTVLKAIALGVVVWISVKGLVPLLVGSAYLSAAGMGFAAWKALLQLLGAACLVFAVVGPADYGLQRWLFMRDQKMSKDDIKRERKDSDGDPQIKGQLKQLQHEMATSDPPQRMPGATVVVTNPTHYAVALRYEDGVTPLPVVVAKGMDAQAAAIRELARLHKIPIIGNPPLARALHKLQIDQPIPEELFDAVAAVLRWVADLNPPAPAR